MERDDKRIPAAPDYLSFQVLLGILVWFLVPKVLVVPWGQGIQGYRAVLGCPSYQRVLGNLGLLCLPFYQENLVVDGGWDRGWIRTNENHKNKYELNFRECKTYYLYNK